MWTTKNTYIHSHNKPRESIIGRIVVISTYVGANEVEINEGFQLDIRDLELVHPSKWGDWGKTGTYQSNPNRLRWTDEYIQQDGHPWGGMTQCNESDSESEKDKLDWSLFNDKFPKLNQNL